MLEFRALVLAAALVLAGCGGDDDSAQPAKQSVQQFGYIRSASTATVPPTIVFDEAEWLTGDEAQKAAVEDGQLQPGEPVPNDYYVRNPDERAVRLPVDEEAAVTAERCSVCRDGKPGELTDFLEAFAERGHTYEDDYRGAQSKYWVTIEEAWS